MPLLGTNHSEAVVDEAPHFESLAELDEWTRRPSKKLSGVLKYHPRSCVEESNSNRGRLLVCHDYKGGYTEKPSGLSYTFNFWSFCDVFIYFAHKRVTIPPSGWTNAVHRQGVKMLGTLIFEHEKAEEDVLRLLVGRLPGAKTGRATPSLDRSLPVSPHYARILAELAHQRGFDGYLLNVECPLLGGPEQTRALSAWIALLRSELHVTVGPHAEVIWYDSVVITGQLRWQDRLNSLNLPFFLPSTGFFTNYTWPPHYPSLTAQYFLSLEPSILDAGSPPQSTPKSLKDIYVGIDVWGRGQHGNGGYGSYKALSHIDPEFLGLSAALFGQAWTWESEQDKPGWDWDKWWAYERTLWIGPEKEGEDVEVPEPPPRQDGRKEPDCEHGSFTPISAFYPRHAPPNPDELAFYTSFCPGVGRAWFVNGVKVLTTDDGWTDVDKQTSLGDMLWPRPTVTWEDVQRADDLPVASSALSMDSAWNGGSSLRLSVSCAASESDDAFFRCVWVPIQSLAVTPRKSYTATLVYEDGVTDGIDLDVGLSVKLLSDATTTVETTPVSTSVIGTESSGWSALSITFSIKSEANADSLAAVGLVIGFATEDPTQANSFSLLLGQLSVAPTLPASLIHKPRLLWADFEMTQRSNEAKTFSGVLAWETATSFGPVTNLALTSPDDPRSVWVIDRPETWSPSFLYFNVYAQACELGGSPLSPEDATFIGNTGLDGRGSRFFVEPSLLPPSIQGARRIRLYVQGVTSTGVSLPWAQCVLVELSL